MAKARLEFSGVAEAPRAFLINKRSRAKEEAPSLCPRRRLLKHSSNPSQTPALSSHQRAHASTLEQTRAQIDASNSRVSGSNPAYVGVEGVDSSLQRLFTLSWGTKTAKRLFFPRHNASTKFSHHILRLCQHEFGKTSARRSKGPIVIAKNAFSGQFSIFLRFDLVCPLLRSEWARKATHLNTMHLMQLDLRKEKARKVVEGAINFVLGLFSRGFRLFRPFLFGFAL